MRPVPARAGRRVARVARAIALAVALVAVAQPLLACGHTPAVARNDDDAIITFSWAEIPDAALWVNGKYIAQLGQLRGGISLSAGTHRLEIRHDDYFPQYVELTVVSRERRRLVIQLAPVLP